MPIGNLDKTEVFKNLQETSISFPTIYCLLVSSIREPSGWH